MRFPNAANGVKKIFSAQILGLVAAIASIVTIALMVIALVAAKVDAVITADVTLIATAVLTLAALVMLIVGFILQIVGIAQAGKDENSFKTAMVCLIVGIVASIVGYFFINTNGIIYGISEVVSKLMSLFVTIFIISGIIKLADQLNDGEVSAKGSNILKIITVIYVLALIATIIVTIMGGSSALTTQALQENPALIPAAITSCIIELVALVLSIVQYFMYLSLLSKAKKMLAE